MHNDRSVDFVCSKAAWNFSRVEEFWTLLKPATPYAMDYLSRREVLRNKEKIIKAYDDIDLFAEFARQCAQHGLAQQSATLDKLQWHLGRIPRLPLTEISADGVSDDVADGIAYDAVEIFIFKKFISNYRALIDLIDNSDIREKFGVIFSSQELAAVLDLGGSDPETFQISERHAPELKIIRAKFRMIIEKIAQKKAGQEKIVFEKFGIDFQGRDFITIPAEAALQLLSISGDTTNSGIAVQSYDEYSCVARMLPDAEILALECEREALREEEAQIESRVLVEISKRVRSQAANFSVYIEAVRRIDLARIKWMLCEALHLTRPLLDSGDFILQEARFIPCENDCQLLRSVYTPVTVVLREKVMVLFGSNMGGKTVTLQTLLFFQVLAQCGFYVPAKKFATSIYRHIDYVGEGEGEKGRGLSGFGFEIRALETAWMRARNGPFLAAFDEFAHSTGSKEAEALLSAVIEAFSNLPGARVFFSTHFMGIERSAAVRYCSMAGLDLDKARKELPHIETAEHGVDAIDVEDSIRRINRMMRYVVIDEDRRRSCARKSDAMEIASLLGLSKTIAGRAEEIYAAKCNEASTGIGKEL